MMYRSQRLAETFSFSNINCRASAAIGSVHNITVALQDIMMQSSIGRIVSILKVKKLCCTIVSLCKNAKYVQRKGVAETKYFLCEDCQNVSMTQLSMSKL